MKSLKVRLTGNQPCMMNNNQMADPLNIYKKTVTTFTSKRKKTDSDHEMISRIEWEGRLYLDENGYIGWPGENMERMLLDAAKKSKDGPKIKEGVRIEENFCKLEFGQNGFRVKNRPTEIDEIPCKELDEIFKKHFDRRCAKQGRDTIVRTRPRFDKWSFEFTILYDEELIDERTLLEIIKVAESRIGCGDYRPRYGTFDAIVLK